MKLTSDQLAAMIPNNPEVDEWVPVLNAGFEKFEINTPKRIAGFISQCAHESNEFRNLEENLNYSADRLLTVYPRYFGEGKRNAAEYARQPEKIANYVYMDKYRSKGGALGNTQEGDGWRFRGKGMKQVTGRSNFTRFGDAFGMTAEEAADWAETKEGALASALWFWGANNLNAIADTGDVAALTKKINGGDIGLQDRRRRFEVAMQAMTGELPPRSVVTETLKVGSKGDAVKRLQRKLGLAADGVFGNDTKKAVMAWQSAHSLVPDGVVGPATLEKLMTT